MTKLIDDVDGTEMNEEDSTHVVFMYRGKSYTMDLSEKNAAAFDKYMDKYISKATEGSGYSATVRSAATAAPSSEKSKWLARVREWANANGKPVADRGRIAQDVKDAYVAEHGDDTEPE